MKSEVFYPSACLLGEGPMWHNQRESCFWVDIEGGALHECSLSSRKRRIWNIPRRVSCVIELGEKKVLLALQGGLASFDLVTGHLQALVGLDKEFPDNRCNDGACDSQGRLWMGTMDINCRQGAGSLYCVGKDLSVEKKLGNLCISNGLTWSADDKLLYHIDSRSFTVKSYSFDSRTGAIGKERTVISVPDHLGMPDGMAMDEEGMLWIAHWDGYGVFRWNPSTGELLDKINVPAPFVSSCAFVGNDLDQLLITTARGGMSPEELYLFPKSGHVFIATPGVKGLKRNSCKIGPVPAAQKQLR